MSKFVKVIQGKLLVLCFRTQCTLKSISWSWWVLWICYFLMNHLSLKLNPLFYFWLTDYY